MNDLTDIRAAYAAIGAPVERVEDERMLRGQGTYVDDIRLPEALHAVILRSPVAHGRLRSIDASAALAMPHAHAVITAAEVVFELGAVPVIPQRQEAIAELEAFYQPVIAHEKVRYAGEPVAVIVARDRGSAEDAMALFASISTRFRPSSTAPRRRPKPRCSSRRPGATAP